VGVPLCKVNHSTQALQCLAWAPCARLKTIQLEWATLQMMRRTHASLSRQAGIDLKLVADRFPLAACPAVPPNKMN
jgi:hypothetical protein